MVSRRKVKGSMRWVVDRVLTSSDGSQTRYRHVAKIQTQRGARAEEQQVVEHWEQHGCLPSKSPSPPTPKSKSRATWEDAVALYRKDGLRSLKPTTKRGYTRMLDGPWMQRWQGVKLTEIDRRAISCWDGEMASAGLAASTRRNHHIVFRVVLKFVGPFDDEQGPLLDRLPGFPALPKVGRTAVEATTPDEVDLLLRRVEQGGLRVAIALAALAGLRSGEARALTRSDVDFERRVIVISKSIGDDEVTTTKGVHARVVPIGDRLLSILQAHLKSMTSTDLVTLNAVKKPWGDQGLYQAYRRVAIRFGVSTTKYHSLRHHYATQLFGTAKADAITVQHLLGHQDLSTTQRYAHHSHERAVAAVAALG